MARKQCIFLMVLGVLGLLFSCSESKEISQKDRPLIGFSMDSFVVERWERERDMFITHVQELGADVLLQVANEDATSQIRQIQYLLKQKVDVLVVVANDSFSLKGVILEAKAQKIPVIAYDRMIEGSQVDLYISFDNIRVGELMAQSMVEALGAGKLVLINGALSDYNSRLFYEGVMNVLDPLLRSEQFHVLDEHWPAHWSNQEAFMFTEKVLAQGVVPDGIIAANDLMAGGAIRALAQGRLAGQVLVTGQDAELSACQRIAEGTQLMTVYKPLTTISRVAAEAAVNIARGFGAGTSDVAYDGEFWIPFIRLEPLLIKREDLVSKVIRDGFHRYEEVFRNIPIENRPPQTP